jgi:hypothetical protein
LLLRLVQMWLADEEDRGQWWVEDRTRWVLVANDDASLDGLGAALKFKKPVTLSSLRVADEIAASDGVPAGS